MTNILEVKNVSKFFGGVRANEDISLSIKQGSIVALIGPNGSGKTTLFNSIVGTHPIDTGSIKFEGKELSKMLVHEIPPLGLLRTFQQTKIYGQMSCMMNMKISKKVSNNYFKMFDTLPKELDDEAELILSFVGLYEKRNLRAGELSFGQQKLLELSLIHI